MNADAHRLAGATALAAPAGILARADEERVPHAAIGCVGGYLFGTLPDLLEPATNPHHRQFFHTWAFAALVACGMYRLYQWEPETAAEKVCRVLGLVAGAAYLAQFALDATTKRSLPVMGKF
jgi:hypothetical protein